MMLAALTTREALGRDGFTNLLTGGLDALGQRLQMVANNVRNLLLQVVVFRARLGANSSWLVQIEQHVLIHHVLDTFEATDDASLCRDAVPAGRADARVLAQKVAIGNASCRQELRNLRAIEIGIEQIEQQPQCARSRIDSGYPLEEERWNTCPIECGRQMGRIGRRHAHQHGHVLEPDAAHRLFEHDPRDFHASSDSPGAERNRTELSSGAGLSCAFSSNSEP